ncbi:MAG: TrkH family potassium uptake protein [Armatimonadota bacterium]
MFGAPWFMTQATASPDAPARPAHRRWISPLQVLALGLITLILIGTLLLSLPVAQRGAGVSILDCFFTATSASCLAGLVTVSTHDAWTLFGQIVILVLIQLSALGYLTAATIVALLLGVRMGFPDRLQFREAHGSYSMHDALRVFRYVLLVALPIEAIGALLLGLRFYFAHQPAMTGAQAAYQGIFYAVSAFCNAGFDLAPGVYGLPTSFLRADGWFFLLIGVLIVLGGLGLGVIAELGRQLVHRRRISLHTKLVVTTTVILIVVGTLFILLFEARNPFTLQQMHGPLPRFLNALFLSVTTRTAGFTPVDLAQVSPPTLFILGLLMIIGASPTGAGAGVKTTTVAVIFLAISTLLRQRSDIEVYRRRIGGEMVRLALSLVSIYLVSVLLIIIGLSFSEITLGGGMGQTETEMTRYGRLMFEVVSAFSNVGLSADVTPSLTAFSRVLIILGMFLGRIGPLIFMYIYAGPKRLLLRRLPSEPVVYG